MLRERRPERGAVLEHDGDAFPVGLVLVIEVVVEVEEPVLDGDPSRRRLVGEMEIDRWPWLRQLELLLDARVARGACGGLGPANVEVGRRRRDGEREERRCRLVERPAWGRAAAEDGLREVVLHPKRPVPLA